MVVAALLTSAIGLLTFCVHELQPELSGTIWFLPLAYFALSVAHSGVRVGRKTYVVDLATGNKRTDYVAISNTVIGVCLLLVGADRSLAATGGPDAWGCAPTACTSPPTSTPTSTTASAWNR